MNKIDLFVSSKNCLKSDNRIIVNLPNGYIHCKRTEIWTLSVRYFSIVNNWYNIETNYNDKFYLSIDSEFTNPIEIRIDQGNPDVYSLEEELKSKLADYNIAIDYIARINKFQFTTDTTIYLKCINCGQFLGFDNNAIVEIIPNGFYSEYPINLTCDMLLFVRIDGDIGLEQAGLTNIWTNEFYPNDVIFTMGINAPPNSLIEYDVTNDDRFKFQINMQSDSIDQFSLQLTNEEGITFDRFNDYQIHLQFEKHNDNDKVFKDKIIYALSRIISYLQQIYLMAANYLRYN